MRRYVVAVGALLALAAVMAGCAAGRDAAGPQPHRVEIELTEFAITPASVAVPAGTVIFAVRSAGTADHDFTIRDGAGNTVAAIATILPDQSETVAADLQPGRYSLVCTYGGHETAGMRAELMVGQ